MTTQFGALNSMQQ